MGSMEGFVELQKTLPKTLKDLEKMAKTSGSLFSDDLKGAQALNDQIERISSGLKRAAEKNAVGLGRNLKVVADSVSAQYVQIVRLVEERNRIEEKGTKRQLNHADQRLQRELRNLQELEKEEHKAAQRALKDLKKFEKAQERLSRNMEGTFFDPKVNPFSKSAMTDMDAVAEYLEDSLGSVADTFGEALSGNLDSTFGSAKKFLTKSQKGLGNLGAVLQAKGQAKGQTDASGLTSMFRMGKGLSKAAAGLTVAVGTLAGIFAIFKIFQALEENVKGIHKELISSYGATDLLADGMTNVSDAVSTIRKGLSDAGFADTLGVSLEEARQLAYTFNEVGINFGSLQDEGLSLQRSISKMKEMTIEFQASAKALGVDFGTLVSFSGEFRKELGISVKNGAYLERMSQEFGRIRDLSKQSILNTKDFFGVVQDLSQGIGSMNIRIGEAANLFVNLSKVLGPEAAQAFTKGLAGGFKGEGIQERFKRIILTGGMKGAFKRTAEQTKKDFFELFKSRKTRKLMSEIGVDRDSDFSKMSDAELERKMGELRRKGGTEGQGAARKLMQAVRLARAGKGGLSNQALALGDLDMSGALSAQFKQLYNVTGGKGFRDVTAIEMEKISQMTGKSLDELEQMRMLDMAMRDDFRVLEDIKANTRGADGRIDEAKAKAELEKAGLSDKLLVQNGKIVDKQGRQVDNIQDYIHAQGAELDAQNINTLTQLDLLQEVVDSTMTSADKINNFLGGILQSILGPVLAISSFLVKDDGKRQESMRIAKEKKEQARLKSKELREERKAERERAGKRKLEISKIKSVEGRKAAQEEEDRLIANAEKRFRGQELDIEMLNEQASLYSEYDKSVQGGDRKQNEKRSRGAAMHRITSGGADKETLAGFVKSKGAEEMFLSILEGQGFSKEDLEKLETGQLEKSKRDRIVKLKRDYGIAHTGESVSIAHEDGYKRRIGRRGYQFSGLSGYGVREDQADFTLFTKQEVDSRQYKALSSEQKARFRESGLRHLPHLSAMENTVHMGGYRTESHESALARATDEDKARHKERHELKEYLSDSKSRLREMQEFAKDQSLTPQERKEAAEEAADIQAETAAKSKRLKEMHKDAVAEALEKRDRDQLQSQMRAQSGLGMDLSNIDLSNYGQRQSAIRALDKAYGEAEDPDRQTELYNLRQKFRMYYGEDAVSASGMTKPMLFHNGYLMEGRSDDSVAFFNPNAPNAGRGGMGGSTIINNYNINGNNPAAMLDTLKRANQSQGMLMG